MVKVDVVELSAEGVTGLGLKLVVTPVGAPETERVTGELKPFSEVTVMVEVSESPCAMLREVGEAEIEKSGAAVTVRLTSTVWVNVPLVPVTVSVEVPVSVETPTETVRVEVSVPSAGGVTEVGLRVAVTPLGAPETERLTAEWKPFSEVTVMVDVSELPG